MILLITTIAVVNSLIPIIFDRHCFLKLVVESLVAFDGAVVDLYLKLGLELWDAVDSFVEEVDERVGDAWVPAEI